MEAFFVISETMTRELGLKGNELLIYAIISGYSQGSQGCFYGSHNWLARVLNIHPDTVNGVLKNLVAKGLVVKEELTIGGVRRCEYTTRKNRVPEKNGYPKNPGGVPEKNGSIIKDIDIYSPTPNSARTIEEMQEEFRAGAMEFASSYGKEMMEAFCDYWAAPVQGSRKPQLLWQTQKTWDLAARLRTWERKDREWSERRGSQGQQQVGPRVNGRGETPTVASFRAARESFQRIVDRRMAEGQIGAEEGDAYDRI